MLGSSSTLVNNDWLISDANQVQREIKVTFYDGQDRPAEVKCPDVLDGKLDIALLTVTNYKTDKAIPLEQNDKELEDEREVLLLAKDPISGKFPSLLKVGRGILNSNT